MFPSPQEAQLFARVVPVTRLVEPSTVAIKQLIRADHETLGRLATDMPRLEFGQRQRRRFGPLRLHRNLQRVLVDSRGAPFERQAGAAQQGGTRRAAGSQYQ